MRKPELIGLSSFKPTLHPIEHFSKFLSDGKTSGGSLYGAGALGSHIIGTSGLHSQKAAVASIDPVCSFQVVSKESSQQAAAAAINNRYSLDGSNAPFSNSGKKATKSPSLSNTGNDDYVALSGVGFGEEEGMLFAAVKLFI